MKRRQIKPTRENRKNSMKYPTFFEYMNARGKTVEKPKIDISGDNIDMPTPKAKEDPHKKNKTPKKQRQLEYLNASGNLVEKPTVDAKADYHGPDPAAPTGNNSGPYRAANSNSGKKTENGSGFGDMGYSNLKYEPNTNPGEKVVSSWPKTKTEQFIQHTKNMSIGEFTTHMLKKGGCGHINNESLPGVTAYATGKIQPHPQEAIKYVVELAIRNSNIMDNVVHEMKATGGLGKLLKTILAHPESYGELTELLDESRSKALIRAMNNYQEAVGPPIGFDKKAKKHDKDDPMAHLADLDDDDHEFGDDDDDDDSGEFGDDEGLGDDELGDDMGGEEDDMLGGGLGGEDDDMGADLNGPDMGGLGGHDMMGPDLGGEDDMGGLGGDDDMGLGQDDMGGDDAMGGEGGEGLSSFKSFLKGKGGFGPTQGLEGGEDDMGPMGGPEGEEFGDDEFGDEDDLDDDDLGDDEFGDPGDDEFGDEDDLDDDDLGDEDDLGGKEFGGKDSNPKKKPHHMLNALKGFGSMRGKMGNM